MQLDNTTLKSPGPDGIPPVFIQKNWDLVGPNICDVVHSFVASGHLLKKVNWTFITLIPKEARVEEVSKFRPISLCNSTY